MPLLSNQALYLIVFTWNCTKEFNYNIVILIGYRIKLQRGDGGSGVPAEIIRARNNV